MQGAVAVTKDENAKIKLHQAVNLTAAGAASGGFWGMLIGMIFLNPLPVRAICRTEGRFAESCKKPPASSGSPSNRCDLIVAR